MDISIASHSKQGPGIPEIETETETETETEIETQREREGRTWREISSYHDYGSSFVRPVLADHG